MKEIYQVKILIRYRGKYLLLKKVRDTSRAYWWLEVLGGKINPRRPSNYSLRELEETDLVCKIITEQIFKVRKME